MLLSPLILLLISVQSAANFS